LGTQKATTAVAVITPILAFGLPVVDTSITLARRLISRKPLFLGDSEHIHHMLLARGWSQRHVVLVLYAVCAAFGLIAAIFTKTSSPITGLVLFVMTVAVIIAVGHLRYHEVDEIRAGVKRTVGERRVRVANNIRIRRASRALGKAPDLYALFETVKQMLEFEEFSYVSIQLGKAGHAEVNERAFKASQSKDHNNAIELRNGRIFWSWHHEGIDPDVVIASGNYWCVRLPLSAPEADWGWMNFYRAFEHGPLLVDLNYLSGLFKMELTKAAERLLSEPRKEEVKLPVNLEAGEITG
jgi:hypothetical protein